tara:strand:+ start:313 stop:558 length:246 start_codon:yes stop_codon:yes gene_type:complete
MRWIKDGFNSYKTELYRVSFGIDKRCDLTEVTITKLSSDEYESFTNLPLLAARLCELIYQGKMSKLEAKKTIGTAMIHLND